MYSHSKFISVKHWGQWVKLPLAMPHAISEHQVQSWLLHTSALLRASVPGRQHDGPVPGFLPGRFLPVWEDPDGMCGSLLQLDLTPAVGGRLGNSPASRSLCVSASVSVTLPSKLIDKPGKKEPFKSNSGVYLHFLILCLYSLPR